MNSAEEPSVRHRWLASTLMGLRRDARMSLTQAAAAAQRSASSLSRIESCVVGIRPRDLHALLDAYDVTDSGLREVMIAVAGEVEAEKRGWWVEHSDALSPSYLDRIRLEADAKDIFIFGHGLVPGLLQIPAYAHAAIAVTGGPDLVGQDDDDLATFIAVRTERQSILDRAENPVHLHAILHESLLGQRLGSDTVVADQVAHLIERAHQPNITIQVLPTHRAHPALTGSYTLLQMATGLAVVHVELMTSDAYLEDRYSTGRYIEASDRLKDVALDPDESIRHLSKILDPPTTPR